MADAKVRTCIVCGKDTGGADNWQWFGRTGPFCPTNCKEEWSLLRDEGHVSKEHPTGKPWKGTRTND